jgi:glycerophosphoryl diester phosphodiesterase
MKIFFESNPFMFTTGGAEPGLIDDTMSNFKNAVGLGSEVIRTNVCLTRDGKTVVASDALYLQKELVKTGVGCYPLNELRKAYQGTAAGGKEHEIFPELSQVLDAFPGQRFNIVLPGKSRDLSSKFCEVIEKKNAAGRVLASSFSGYNIKVIRERLPDIATSFSFIGVIGFYALYKSGLLYFKKKFKPDAMLIPEMVGASFIANEGLIQETKSRGIRVYLMYTSGEDQARGLLMAGVDGFVTNNAEMIKRIKGIA